MRNNMLNMKDLNNKRLDFNLNNNSNIINIGGFTGEWAFDIYNKYECNMYIYEPVIEYFNILKNKFKGKEKVHLFNYGVLDKDTDSYIKVDGDGTSLFKGKADRLIHLRDISSIINDINSIDLIEINAEGAEYSILNKIYETNNMSKIKYFLIQFHSFIEDSNNKLKISRDILNKTHTNMWNIDFVFECWKLK